MELSATDIVDAVWAEVGHYTIQSQKLMAVANVYANDRTAETNFTKMFNAEEVDANEYKIGLKPFVALQLKVGLTPEFIMNDLIAKHRQESVRLAFDAMDLIFGKPSE